MSTSSRITDLLRSTLALLILAAAIVGGPLALWRLGGEYLPDRVPSWEEVTVALGTPDSGAVFLGLLTVIGWTAWAVFALSVVVEASAQLRGMPPVRLPGLAAPQQLAGLLVAAAIGAGAAPILAVPALAGPSIVTEHRDDEPVTRPAPTRTAEPTAPAGSGPVYTVRPRDTLGRIAARHLGDWTRFEEILDLNRGRPQLDGGALTDPGLIRPGWTLVLPPDATGLATETPTAEAIVQLDDTLSDIAAEHGLDHWRPIFDLNAGEPLPDGGRFTDPDLIIPGQVLDIPAAVTPAAPAPVSSEPPPADDSPLPPFEDEPPVPAEPRAFPTRSSVPESAADRPDNDPAGNAERTEVDGDESPSALAVVLGGSGALLAAGVGAVWLSHHRQRLRRRRHGRRLAPLPGELSASQEAVAAAAAAGHADYAALDRALRTLAVLISEDLDGRLPDVVAARLGGRRLELLLHGPADGPPPAPWTADGSGERWSLDLTADTGVDIERARTRLAPYPALVTIGSDGGWQWLLDLERAGGLRVTGPGERREDFARHLAAELAVNSWSDLLTVTTVGFGDEIVDIAPDRLQSVHTLSDRELGPLRAAVADTGDDVLQGRLRAAAGDGWMPRVVLVPGLPGNDDQVSKLAGVLRGRDERSPAAVVIGAESVQGSEEWVIMLNDDGELLIPALDLRLPAPQLTADQARDIATLLAFERSAPDEPIPAAEGDRPWQARTDAAGALRDDVTVSLTVEPPGRADVRQATQGAPAAPAAESAPSQAAGHAETTSDLVDDERRRGGSVAPVLRRQIENDLEQLDRDLADWWSPDCARPRLTVLGPVALRAHGDEVAIAKSGLRRRYEEAVAYFATRPHGATVDEAAEALQPARGGRADPVSARAYVHRVSAGARAWLGTDPLTGEKHLSSGHRGPYALTGVLVDADLFRQLRARAAVRGNDGLPDLLAALQLVSGPPFAQRPAGYEWLDGLDLTLIAAVCDVAHQVVTAALAGDDLAAAGTASATALLVAPDDEQVLLDAMWVAFHQGNRAEAETYVARIVAVHDGEDEMDLPMSTAETINRARRRFLDRAS